MAQDIAIAFCFEDFTKNIYSGAYESDVDIWRMTAKSWGCTHYIMIDLTTDELSKYYKHLDADIEYERYFNYDDLIVAHPYWKFVYSDYGPHLDKQNIPHVSLPKFEHPTGNVCYVMGPDSGSSLVPGREQETWISVPNNLAGWSLPVSAAILYDRYAKLHELF